MLIIAHVPCGMPIPFTCDLIDSARVLLAKSVLAAVSDSVDVFLTA